jgi:hypothetical protein
MNGQQTRILFPKSFEHRPLPCTNRNKKEDPYALSIGILGNPISNSSQCPNITRANALTAIRLQIALMSQDSFEDTFFAVAMAYVPAVRRGNAQTMRKYGFLGDM